MKQLFRSIGLLSLFVLFFVIPGYSQSAKGKTILAIFAHPDDESTTGPVLAKYASEGAAVYLVTATDGRLGVAEHAHIPAGDSLASVRKDELFCAARALGIHPPIMLGLHDQMDMRDGMGGISKSLDSLRKALRRIFAEINPDVVITWGGSAWTGHPDHMLVGDVATEIFASRQWPKNPSLFYVELPNGSLPEGLSFATTDIRYLTVQISLSADDIMKAKAAWSCHKSQYTQATVDNMHGQLWKSATAYFRPFVSVTGVRNSFFTK
ncbi:MAG: PIG-L deacetylase family protein [Chitinophagales bacterium]